jgi:hypothetical protein
MADAVAEAIPGIIRDAAANARRANLGLIIPGNGNMTKIDLSKMRDPGGSGRG